jgi:hypothetical protein
MRNTCGKIIFEPKKKSIYNHGTVCFYVLGDYIEGIVVFIVLKGYRAASRANYNKHGLINFALYMLLEFLFFYQQERNGNVFLNSFLL